MRQFFIKYSKVYYLMQAITLKLLEQILYFSFDIIVHIFGGV